jgi:hypothetical protein
MSISTLAAKPQHNRPNLASLLAGLPGFIPDHWLILRLSKTANERGVARHGNVEIRHIEGRFSAQTRVKGERNQALATALCRFRQFLSRTHRSGIELRLSRPLVQSEEAPGRWMVRMGLSGLVTDVMSPASRGGRVKVRHVPPETVAVLRVSGRASGRALEWGAQEILESTAGTPWIITGPPILRLHGRNPILPFVGHFEVAVPVLQQQTEMRVSDRPALPTASARNPEVGTSPSAV